MRIMQLIAERKVFPVYQPIIDSVNNKTFGREALAREPTGQTPDILFQEADKYGLIRNLDLLCLYNAIENVPDNKPLFVNLLPFTLMWLLASNRIKKVFDKIRGPVVFEVVEIERIASDMPSFLMAIDEIKKRGFQVAVDDVSQGFDRLHIIPSMCPDYIKIDRTLTSNGTKNYNNIIKHIINIGDDIGAKMIAEGVETEKEYRNLLSLGINYFQGFYFAKPGDIYFGKENEHAENRC